MSNQPPPYNRQYNFEDYQSLNPTTPLPGDKVEAELNAARSSVNQTISRLNEIQNADGSLKVPGALVAQTTDTATSVATTVATTTAANYLAANYDPTVAVQAAASASDAASWAADAASSKQLAEAHMTNAEAAGLVAQNAAIDSAIARSESRSHAIDANQSRNEAHASAQSAAASYADVGQVYGSALSLKNWIDSQAYQFVHKREETVDVAANMLFNDGEVSNTLIGKIFQGASVGVNSDIQYVPPVSGGPGNMNIFSGPWWVDGHESPEPPHRIIMRDMFSCLADTWLTFGPRSTPWQGVEGNIKPRQEGVNGVPNGSFHIGPERIKGVNYTKENFNIGLTKGSSPLTPKSYVDEADTSLSVRIDQKASKSGDTFTGKLITTQTTTTAPLNIGFLSSPPTVTVAGDFWLGDNLNFRDKNGTIKLVANQNTSNTFTQTQSIAPPASSTLPALRITNTGTGESLRIEDESPESTPFVVGSDGRVGIHGSPANNAAHKLAIYNGNIVFSSGFGIAFGDGTVQTTASQLPDMNGFARVDETIPGGSNSYNLFKPGIIPVLNNSGYKNYFAGGTVSGLLTTTAIDGNTGLPIEVSIGVTNTGAEFEGYSILFKINSNKSLNEYELVGSNTIFWYLGDGTTSLQQWGQINTIMQSGGSNGITIIQNNPSPYVSVGVLDGMALNLSIPEQTGNSFVYEEGLNSHFVDRLKTLMGSSDDYYRKTIVAINKNELAAVRVATFDEVSEKLSLAGGTLTGKLTLPNLVPQPAINIGTANSMPGSMVSGDMVITDRLSYVNRQGNTITTVSTNQANTIATSTTSGAVLQVDQSGTASGMVVRTLSASAAASTLRVENRGSGPSFLVEDSITPDTNLFVIDASGNVGVGLASNYTATSKVEVAGNIKATTLSTGTGPTFSLNSTSAHTGGSDTLDAIVTINGVNYRIGLRPA